MGTGHRMLPTEFFPNRPSLPWQRNLRQWAYVKDISKIFESNFKFSKLGYFGIMAKPYVPMFGLATIYAHMRK